MAKQIKRSRELAFGRQGGKCYACGLQMCLDGSAGPRLLRCTAEHVIARSEGGGDGPSNIIAACLHCNRTRHRRTRPPEPERYRAEVRRRVQRGSWLPRPALVWAKAQSVTGQPRAGAS